MRQQCTGTRFITTDNSSAHLPQYQSSFPRPPVTRWTRVCSTASNTCSTTASTSLALKYDIHQTKNIINACYWIYVYECFRIEIANYFSILVATKAHILNRMLTCASLSPLDLLPDDCECYWPAYELPGYYPRLLVGGHHGAAAQSSHCQDLVKVLPVSGCLHDIPVCSLCGHPSCPLYR